MKILEIIPDLGQGGAERFVVDLSNQLSKQGHDVTVVSLYDIKNPIHGFFKKDLSDSCNIISYKKKHGFDILLIFRLLLLFITHRPDVIHTHLGAFRYCFLSMYMLRRIRYYHTVHNIADKENCTKLDFKLKRIAFGKKLCRAITISDVCDRSFFELYSQKAQMIYNGRPSFHLDETIVQEIRSDITKISHQDTIKIVNVARIGKQKNQEALAKAVNEINIKSDKKLELLFIGNNDIDDSMKPIVDEIKALNSPYIHLLGPKDNARYYMNICDAFILSSIYEGMPITLIEALSVGALILSTPVGGVVDMIKDGENGLLSVGSDVNDLHKLLLRFLELDDNKVKQLKQNAISSYAKYSIENCGLNYERAFSL